MQEACDILLESSRQGGYNFASNLISIRGLHVKLQAPKVVRVPIWQFWDSHLGVLRQNAIWRWASWRGTKYIIRGKVVASPSPGCGESCESELPVARPSTKNVSTMH